jgi:hypothetical protein
LYPFVTFHLSRQSHKLWDMSLPLSISPISVLFLLRRAVSSLSQKQLREFEGTASRSCTSPIRPRWLPAPSRGSMNSRYGLFGLLLAIPVLFPIRGNAQTPQLTSISPSTLAPGMQATITGSGFGASQGSGDVDLWNSNFAPVVSWSDTRIVVTVPAGTKPGKCWVKQNGSWSNGVAFAMVGPKLRSISPSSFSPGTEVRLTGSGFGASQGIGYVDLWNSNFAPVVSWSDRSIVVRVPAGTVTGNAYVNQNGTWSKGVRFSSTAGSAGLRATPVNFGIVQVGSSSTQSSSPTNLTNSTVTVSNASISGAGFTLSGLTAPLALKPAESITFKVTFAPKTRGVASGDVLVASNASDANLPVPLTGVGESTGILTLVPSTASLGNVPVGN